MCGICGILNINGGTTPISLMNDIQSHRGPDDEGYVFINPATEEYKTAGGSDTQSDLGLQHHKTVDKGSYNLALASRRLAILDLSSAGHMPMSYQNSRLWITYNGEIYNYKELRLVLETYGYPFNSDSDTEVILAAYAHWGQDCLCRLNGMFAFALYDSDRKTLFCARDRFGIKPFYYYWNDTIFAFASEIKALVQHPNIPRKQSDQSIFDYLVLGVSDHTENTFFEGIKNIRPGHFLLLDIDQRLLSEKRWWDIDINPDLETSSNKLDDEVYAQYGELLEDAVRLRLRSDVPVGSALSGGLDSSSVVFLANRLLLQDQVIPKHLVGDHQKTFTARNYEDEIDEYQYSNLIVRLTGAEENLIHPTGETLWNEFERFAWYLDEPVNSTSQYPQWNVMRLARQRGVTVLLDGQGGDETLVGYYHYLPSYVRQIKRQSGYFATIKAISDLSRVGGAPVVDTLLQHGSRTLPWKFGQIADAIRPMRTLPGTGGSGIRGWQISQTFLSQFSDRTWQPNNHLDETGLAGIMRNELFSTNLPKLLRYEDRNSMAFSLETRLPYLDYRLIEFVFSLPLSYRIHEGWTKWILRQAMKDHLPPEIIWRKSKLGFPTPEVKWFLQGVDFIRNKLREYDTAPINHYLQTGMLKSMSDLPDEELVASPGLWRILNLGAWFDLYFERSSSQISELMMHTTFV